MMKPELDIERANDDRTIELLLNVTNLAVTHLCSKKLIVKDLNFGICSNLDLGPYRKHISSKLMITGPSGVGKTTILRCICGLLRPSAGEIEMRNTVLVIPQRALLVQGSLRDNIFYPLTRRDNSTSLRVAYNAPWYESFREDAYRKVVSDLEIEHLEKMMDVDDGDGLDCSFYNRMSPGEQQIILMARVLYHRPSLVILDEISSSVDLQTTIKFYSLLHKFCISYITISHDKDKVGSFHHHTLEISSGNWSWRVNDDCRWRLQ